MADGKVLIDIDLDDKNYKSALERLKGATGGAFATMGKMAVAGIAAASTAVAGLAGIGLKYNMQMENFTTNFKVMLGSQEAAVAKVEELKQMAAKTPFGMADLADATQTLLAFQVPAEDTIDILKMLGDISLGNKEKLGGLALVFGQVSSAGKLSGQDLLQFINQGFNPLNYIAERTGESMAELRTRMSAGAIGVDEVRQALQDATAEGGQFYKGMEEASKTTAGLISTLKDNVYSLIGQVFEPLSNSLLTDIVPAVIDAVDQLTTAFEEDGLQGLIETAGDLMADFVTAIVDKLPDLLQAGTDILTSIVEGLLSNQEELSRSISLLLDTLIQTVMSLIPLILELGVQILIALVEGISDNIDLIIDAIITLILLLVDTLTNPDTIVKLINAAFNIMDAIANGLIQAIPRLIAKIPQIITAIKTAFDTYVQNWLNIGKNIVDGIWNGIKNGWTWLMDQVKGLVDNLVSGVKNWLGIKSPSRVGKYIGEMFDKGIELGISDNEDKTVEAAKRLARNLSVETAATALVTGETNAGNVSNVNNKTVNMTFNSAGPLAPFEAYRRMLEVDI